MSESQLVTETESVDPQSPEDKFFGVKTTFEKKKKPVAEDSSSSDYEIEIVDDRPPEDRRPPKAESKSESDDEELGDYSEKVQKRLNKLKFDYHEERRQREAAERMREEAVKIAQQYATKNQTGAQQHEVIFLAGFKTFVFGREYLKVVANLLVLLKEFLITTFRVDGIGGDALDPL